MNKKESIKRELTGLAFKITKPFCYNCYEEVSKGKTCLKCGSSDLMRLLEGVGVEYGVDWVIESLLESNLSPVDKEEAFSNMIEDCYGVEIEVAFLKLSPVRVIKEMNPLDWKIAQDEYISSLEEEGEIMSFDNGSTYFHTSDIENLIEEKIAE